MKIQLAVGLILSCILLVSTVDDGQDNTPDILIQNYEAGTSFYAKSTSGKLFTSVHISKLESKYLFIHLQPDEASQNFPFTMYVYTENNPNPVKVCQKQALSECYLNKNQLKPDSNMLILTDCPEENYGFTIRTYWSNLQHLQINSQTKFFFSKEDQSQFYHLQLPNTDFYELRIIMKPETVRSPFDKVKIYGTFGDNKMPSAQDYDFKSIHLWEDAQGVFLYGKEVKDKKLNILIEGQIQTVYTLSCQSIQKQHHDLELKETVHEYLEPGQDFMYHAQFINNATKTLEFQQYVLTFSGFSGKLSLGFYQDQAKKHSLEMQPFSYLSDAQYIFKRDQVEKELKEGLFIYVHALQRKSIYSITFYGRNLTEAIELKQNIYEFFEISAYAQQLAYFQIFQWKNDSHSGDLQYSITMTDVLGQHDIEFRTCQGSIQECTNLKTYEKSTTPMKAEASSIGTKVSYFLNVSRNLLQPFNEAESFGTVIMLVRNKESKENYGVVAVQVHSENKIEFLREGKPVETRIKQGQYKVFKYKNEDPFLREIKIYTSQIAGKIDIYSLREAPTRQNPYGKEETTSVISFKEELTSKPIFIIVQGKQEAIFSLQLVATHKSDASLSSFTLSQDLTSKLRIKPQGSEIVEVIPISDAIYFEFDASASILVCPIDEQTGDCEQKYVPKLIQQGQINIENFSQRSKLFKVVNPSPKQTIEVSLIYHSRDYAHCEQKQVGQLYFETIHRGEISKEGEGFQNNCFSFSLLREAALTLSLSRVDLGGLHYAVAICDKIFKSDAEVRKDTITIQKEKINNACKNAQSKTISLMVSPHKSQEEKNKVVVPFKVKYLVEYVDSKVLTLPDGVAYDFQARSTESEIKTFYYDLINKKETNIKLMQYEGYGSFTVLIAATSQKENQLENSNYDFSFSKGDSYFSNPTITLTKEQLEAKDCEECSLIIKVYSVSDLGAKVHFGIEVTQNHYQLEDHTPRDGFLTTGSIDYYRFTTVDADSKGSLLVSVADNNLRCVSIYLSDSDYPDQKNYIKKEEGNKLVLEDVKAAKTYYIGIKASSDCPYSVSLSSTRIPITKLARGTNEYIKLKQGEVRYFMIEHIQKREFKVLSLLEFGETYFYLNRTTADRLEEVMKDQSGQLKFEQFQVKSQYANRLVLHQNNSYLVEYSYYLLAVQAKAETEGYIFYGDSSTALQIVAEATINDQLSVQGETFTGYYYGNGPTKLAITVIAGQLALKIEQKGQEKPLEKNYSAAKTAYQYEFDIKNQGKSFFLSDPIHLLFSAIQPSTIYSVRFLRSDPNNSPNTFQVEPGQPNYFYLDSKKKSHNITGTLTKHQELFLTVPIDEKDTLNNFKLMGYVENQLTTLKVTTVRNVMKVTFSDRTQGVVDFSLNIRTEKSVLLTVFQNYGVNLLPPDTQILVEGTADYVLYPEGSVLLDVFECNSNASILYSKTKSTLDQLDPKSLNLIGMPSQPHAIKILNPGTTFLRVSGERQYIRWLPMDGEKQKGMGYLNYDIGEVTYTGSLLELSVSWGSVYAKRQTKTQIKKTNYVLVVGESIDSVKNAINCQHYYDSGLLHYSYRSISPSKQELTIALSKSQIKQKYPENKNLFIGVIGQVQLQIPGQTEQKSQHYRFVYPIQEVPMQVFTDYTVASKDIWILVLVAAGSLLLLTLTCCICVKKILPILSRFRQGNMMVEEQKDEREFDVVPPSSDRNDRNNNLGTEQQMNHNENVNDGGQKPE